MRGEKFHLSPHDGLYRKCQIRTQPCPFAIPEIEHKTIPQLAASGGAKFTDGAKKKGTLTITEVVNDGFMVLGQERRRTYHADGEPMYGKEKRTWFKSLPDKFRKLWAPLSARRAASAKQAVRDMSKPEL